MSMELAMKPLKIMPGKCFLENNISIALSLEALRQKLRDLSVADGFVVLWQVNCISWGKWTAGALSFAGEAPKDGLIFELRVFNEQEELHLRKQGRMLKGRYRKDTEGEEAEYVDSVSRFWGKRDQTEDGNAGYITLKDADRKLSMELPDIGTTANYYALETRSYVGISPRTAQAGYVDYRFKAIIPADVKGDET